MSYITKITWYRPDEKLPDRDREILFTHKYALTDVIFGEYLFDCLIPHEVGIFKQTIVGQVVTDEFSPSDVILWAYKPSPFALLEESDDD